MQSERTRSIYYHILINSFYVEDLRKRKFYTIPPHVTYEIRESKKYHMMKHAKYISKHPKYYPAHFSYVGEL